MTIEIFVILTVVALTVLFTLLNVYFSLRKSRIHKEHAQREWDAFLAETEYLFKETK